MFVSVTSTVKTWMPGTRPGMTGWRMSVWLPKAPPRHVFSAAFFGANVALRLSNSSTFTPFFRMM